QCVACLVECVPGARRAQAPHRGRHLEAEPALVVGVVHAHPWPFQRTRGVQAGRERAGRLVAGAPGSGRDTLVVVAVRVGDRAARAPEPPLALEPGSTQLVLERGFVDLGEMRVRAGVRADLPATVSERT